MAAENWDDHDRSGRFTALEVAKNYLNSCDKNAILFTNGDNDTFPLWYAQEVEGIRTDIKVVNLSLFNTDWYIDQMKRASYDAAPIPSSLEHDDYRTGTRDYLAYQKRYKNEVVGLKSVLDYIRTHGKETVRTQNGTMQVHIFPAKKIRLAVNKEIAKTFVPEEHHNKIVDEIQFKVKGNNVMKNKLMVFDILANFNWERPIYFATTVGRDNFMGLEKYFQLEGLAYRLVPYVTPISRHWLLGPQTGAVNTDKMYDLLVNQFEWGGLNNPDLYFDETNTRMVMGFRSFYARLAESLAQKGDTTKAIKTLDKCIAEFSRDVVNLSHYSVSIIELYYAVGEIEKGNKLLATMVDDYLTEVNYLKEFDSENKLRQKIQGTTQLLSALAQILQMHKLEDSNYSYSTKDDRYYKHLLEDSNLVTIADTEVVNDIEIDYATYRINTFMDDFIKAMK
jgi:tetratricopeptide (TPR) repeat protein